ALVGHNGAGKSTLMRVLAGGDIQMGERIIGHNVVLDYFAQDQAAELDPTRSAYEELLAGAPYDVVPQLRDLLGAFLFSGDDIHKKVAVLSGGERNRLALARMLLKPANLLLMDEPTNHLDLFSKEVLLEALKSFTGTVVFVSHDRYFIDGLASRVVEVADGGITSYHGDYEYYLAKKVEMSDTGEAPSSLLIPASLSSTGPGSRVPASKEERQQLREEEKQRQRENQRRAKRLAELEAAIEQEESRLTTLETRMADPSFFADPEQARRGGDDHAAITARIAALYGEWEELSALTGEP
ncbi:MAG TPA: ATP-binding cassette domain-containing protein, partial [Geomobilimonas sp.]|nr:ATP-binding cassette domain-containing protein [Geomobilimonas sp.]